MPALSLKVFGAVSLGLIYQFYYKGGDTYNYFHDASYIYELSYYNFSEAWGLITIDTENPDYYLLGHLEEFIFITDGPSHFIVRVASLLSFFTFGSYMSIAVFFAVASFIGVWCGFIALTKLYPKLEDKFAICFFFLPSVFFWGSGLMKDSLSISALCLAFYAFVNIFIFKKSVTKNVLILILSLYLLKTIKIYIALCFIPSILVWLFTIFSNKFKSAATRNFIRPILVIIGVSCGLFAAGEFAKENEQYNLDNIAHTAKTTSEYILGESEKMKGSTYSLGDYDESISGMLQKMPQAIWVTLYRPYIWESKNAVMILSALESLFFLIMSYRAIRRVGLSNLFAAIQKNPYIQFALIFSLTFSFAVGLTSYNFGTLVRYKIQMMPFFLSVLYILQGPEKKKSKKSIMPKMELEKVPS